jgi:acyl-CoA hydrolase
VIAPAAALEYLHPGMTVFVPGMSGESLAFFDLLRSHPDRAEGLCFVGAHFPSVNHNDYLGLHPTARLRAYFMSPSVRGKLASGRVDLLPLDYAGIVRDLESTVKIDLAIAQVSSPDANGMCSLGPSLDFLPSVWNRARLRIAHVNPLLPRTHGTFAISLKDCTLAFESEAPVPTLAGEATDAATQRHAQLVAELVADGDTLQFGIGRLQTAILHALKGHRRLRILSGMVSPGVFDLLQCGALSDEHRIECGVALGEAAFYHRLDGEPRFCFRPVRETHDVRRIAAINNFCAINSAIEVDLFGQVNVDCLKGRLVAGVGGLPAFAAGARLSCGGRSIIALPATGDAGRTSRIACPQNHPAPVALPRHEADYVVTEFGVADLRGRGIQARAEALIAIAAPQFREDLAADWRVLLGQL